MSKLFHSSSVVADGNMAWKYGDKKEVENNRRLFLDKNNIGSCVFTWLDGEDEIKVVNKDDVGKTIKADALITKEKDLALFMVTADCFPVIIYGENILALVHVGRTGVEKKLLPKVLEQMKSEALKVIIGPGIRKESYLYKDIVQKDDPQWQPFLSPVGNNMTSVDLFGFIKKQLLDAGIAEKDISDSGIDTARDLNYFSHYRSVKLGEPEGRFATVVLQRL